MNKPVKLEIEALFRDDDPLYFRERLGGADGADGAHYDLDVTVSGGALICTVKRPNEPRRTYEISSQHIVEAVARADKEARVDKAEDPPSE